MQVELKNIRRLFGRLTVIDDVSLVIEEGHLFTLLGPSGCGKTTLPKIVAGFHAPDAGQVLFAGTASIPSPTNAKRDGLPDLRPVPAPDRFRQRRPRAGRAEPRKIRSGRRWRRFWRTFSSTAWRRFPNQLSGGTAAARRPRGRWCSRPGSSPWTNPCLTSMRA